MMHKRMASTRIAAANYSVLGSLRHDPNDIHLFDGIALNRQFIQ